MSRLDGVGERDGWRCWVCDEPVDPEMSVNDGRGPSIDSLTTRSKKKAKGGSGPEERLAHRDCNTRKGAVPAVVPWPDRLFVTEPAPIIAAVERLQRKGGREVVARCPTESDGQEAATWLVDRISRLSPTWPSPPRSSPAGASSYLSYGPERPGCDAAHPNGPCVEASWFTPDGPAPSSRSR